jgi:hypothetical protein
MERVMKKAVRKIYTRILRKCKTELLQTEEFLNQRKEMRLKRFVNNHKFNFSYSEIEDLIKEYEDRMLEKNKIYSHRLNNYWGRADLVRVLKFVFLYAKKYNEYDLIMIKNIFRLVLSVYKPRFKNEVVEMLVKNFYFIEKGFIDDPIFIKEILEVYFGFGYIAFVDAFHKKYSEEPSLDKLKKLRTEYFKYLLLQNSFYE